MKLEHMRGRYSASAQFFHWLSALLVGLAWLLGQLRDDFERGEPRRDRRFCPCVVRAN